MTRNVDDAAARERQVVRHRFDLRPRGDADATIASRRRQQPTPNEEVARIERAIAALERYGRTRQLDAATRTCLRIRMMKLVDRLEIEQGKQRIVEGHYAAARYHLSAARRPPVTVRLALVGLRLAPRVARAAYLTLLAATSALRAARVR